MCMHTTRCARVFENVCCDFSTSIDGRRRRVVGACFFDREVFDREVFAHSIVRHICSHMSGRAFERSACNHARNREHARKRGKPKKARPAEAALTGSKCNERTRRTRCLDAIMGTEFCRFRRTRWLRADFFWFHLSAKEGTRAETALVSSFACARPIRASVRAALCMQRACLHLFPIMSSWRADILSTRSLRDRQIFLWQTRMMC